VTEHNVNGAELADLHRRFEREIFPLLTPLVVDRGHPFPFVDSLSLNLALFVREPAVTDPCFALVRLPKELPLLITVGRRRIDVALEDVVGFFLPRLFPHMRILDSAVFKVTRVVDWDPDAPGRQQTRVARLEVSDPVSQALLERLMAEFKLSTRRLHHTLGPSVLTTV
jgi:polyphosphate kinase